MRELDQHERAQFFQKHFGVTGDQPIKERKNTSLDVFTLDGRPILSREYRAAHRALLPGQRRRTPAEWEAWILELENGATS